MIALALGVFWKIHHDKNDLATPIPVAINASPPNIVGKPGAGIPAPSSPAIGATRPPALSAPSQRPSQSGSALHQSPSPPSPSPENARAAAPANTTSPPIVKKIPPPVSSKAPPSIAQPLLSQPSVNRSAVNHPPASPLPENQPPARQPASNPPPLSADGMMQNAQAALARGNLISPADDSALYWARRVQEVQPQNQTAIRIEDMILVGSIRLIQAEEKASRYENASRRLDALQALYPSRRDLLARMRSELKAAQSADGSAPH
jgi:hypothetical protein